MAAGLEVTLSTHLFDAICKAITPFDNGCDDSDFWVSFRKFSVQVQALGTDYLEHGRRDDSFVLQNLDSDDPGDDSNEHDDDHEDKYKDRDDNQDDNYKGELDVSKALTHPTPSAEATPGPPSPSRKSAHMVEQKPDASSGGKKAKKPVWQMEIACR